jgi:hypothetical protein
MKPRLFPVQPKLPHVPEPTHADIRAFVKEKLHGFEYRQAAREAKRKPAPTTSEVKGATQGRITGEL